MGVTTKLLELYRVDQQLRGLTGRLKTAEAYLAEQDKLLSALKTRHDTLATQLKQLEASAHNDENEAKGIEQRIEMLRERMNTAQTTKEHQALNTEVATLKADKGLIEERALASMQKLEKSRVDVAAIDAQVAEREKVREIAKRDRDERQTEIAARLGELNGERTGKLDGLNGDALNYYNQRLNSGAEHVMAPLEEMDRRNLEYSCGACFTVLPIELVSVLLKRGDLTKCPSCKVILFMEATLKDEIATSQEKKKGLGPSSLKNPKVKKKTTKKTVPDSDTLEE
ncbi:MAG: zinc ribbon domain-containing protein [Phycisphaerales bacterium]